MSVKLYVGNLSFQTSSDDLQQLFAQVGTVESATVVEDRDTGRSRGFGFVEMASKEEGQKAIDEFNGKDLNGRNLTVNEARPREDRGNRGGGRRVPHLDVPRHLAPHAVPGEHPPERQLLGRAAARHHRLRAHRRSVAPRLTAESRRD